MVGTVVRLVSAFLETALGEGRVVYEAPAT